MNDMFQTTDSSNDEICGFDGESHPNGNSSKSYETKKKPKKSIQFWF